MRRKSEEWQRQAQLVASKHAPAELLDQPLRLTLAFVFERPKKPKFEQPAVKPDADKLMRFIGDVLSGVIYVDDSRVVEAVVSKRYGEDEGCHVEVAVVGSDA